MKIYIIKADCGCEFETSSTGQIFRWCPLHKAAPEMYEALKVAWNHLAPKCHEPRIKEICDKIGMKSSASEILPSLKKKRS